MPLEKWGSEGREFKSHRPDHSYNDLETLQKYGRQGRIQNGIHESILFKNYRELVKPTDATAFWEIKP